MKTLIIFSAIPEQTHAAIYDLTEEQYNKLLPANGYTINVDYFDEAAHQAVMAINSGFSTNPDHRQYCESELDKELFGKFTNLFGKVTDINEVEKIIICGFLL